MAELIVPPDLRERHRRGLARYLAGGPPRVLDRRIEIDGDARRRHALPGRADDHPHRRARRARVHRLPARHHRAPRAEAELRASRARIVEAADAARRRIERDLHDGAQQQLVSVAISLRRGPRPHRRRPGGRARAARRGQRRPRAAGSTSCASWPAASIPPSSSRAASSRRCAGSCGAARCRRGSRRARRAAPGAGRGRGLLRRRPRGSPTSPATPGRHARRDRRRAPRTGGSWSRSATTAAAAPTPRGGGLRGLADRFAALDGSLAGAQPAGRRDDARRGGPMRVVIAEDSVLLREGAVRLLEEAGIEVVGQAGDAEELLRKVRAHKPDVAIVDIRMPPDYVDEGLKAAAEIRRELPSTGVLDPVAVRRGALRDGAARRPAPRASATCSRTASRRSTGSSRPCAGSREGGSVLDPEVVAEMLGRRRPERPAATRSPSASATCWRLMAEGLTNRAIAGRHVRHRARRRAPRHVDLREARAGGRRRRPPPRARGARLPRRVKTPARGGRPSRDGRRADGDHAACRPPRAARRRPSSRHAPGPGSAGSELRPGRPARRRADGRLLPAGCSRPRPPSEPLFASTDLPRQKAMLLGALVLLRKSLRDLDAIVPKLRELGARHVAYGAEPGPLPGRRRGAHRLDGGGRRSGVATAYARAWATAYGVVAGAMLEGAASSSRSAPPPDGPAGGRGSACPRAARKARAAGEVAASFQASAVRR